MRENAREEMRGGKDREKRMMVLKSEKYSMRTRRRRRRTGRKKTKRKRKRRRGKRRRRRYVYSKNNISALPVFSSH